jgi:3',5'-cyclic-AMP phosphodiesterase
MECDTNAADPSLGDEPMSHSHNHSHVSNYITDDASDDGIDRRGFLKCMAWAGTGIVWAVKSGVPTSIPIGRIPLLSDTERKSIFFAQLSDSHIGFSKEANKDVTATLREAVAKLNALPQAPAFVLHTGDISQLSLASEFDTADQVLRELRTDSVFFVPGEHDVLNGNGKSYLARYGQRTGAKGGGWYSFDHSGVHFVGLVNVLDLKAGGFGSLGSQQLDWLRRDLVGLASSTPIVVFAHVPVSPQGRFPSSPVLDTNQRHSVTINDSGTFDYFCSIHPVMTGRIVVR